MSTNYQPTSASTPSQAQTQSQPVSQPATPVANPIIELVNTMQAVNMNAPQAKLNATSISDGNGGRIEFNEDLTGTKVIK